MVNKHSAFDKGLKHHGNNAKTEIIKDSQVLQGFEESLELVLELESRFSWCNLNNNNKELEQNCLKLFSLWNSIETQNN